MLRAGISTQTFFRVQPFYRQAGKRLENRLALSGNFILGHLVEPFPQGSRLQLPRPPKRRKRKHRHHRGYHERRRHQPARPVARPCANRALHPGKRQHRKHRAHQFMKQLFQRVPESPEPASLHWRFRRHIYCRHIPHLSVPACYLSGLPRLIPVPKGCEHFGDNAPTRSCIQLIRVLQSALR